MATAHAPEAHAHAHGKGAARDHVPHVLPLKVYFGVFVMLLVFTGITVGVSYVDIGRAGNLAVALVVATMKAAMVGLIFMHLAFDRKFNAVVFSMSVLFLGIFIALTMYDTEYRGLGGRVEADRPADVTNPFAGGTQREKALKQKWQASGAHPEEVEGQEAIPAEGTPAAAEPPAPTTPLPEAAPPPSAPAAPTTPPAGTPQ